MPHLPFVVAGTVLQEQTEAYLVSTLIPLGYRLDEIEAAIDTAISEGFVRPTLIQGGWDPLLNRFRFHPGLVAVPPRH